MVNVSEIQRKLEMRRDEILQMAAKIDKHIGFRDEPLSADSEERAIELENVDALFEIDNEARYELKLINDAIQRIEDGKFGHCTVCGAHIDLKRLSAIPYIDTCFSCA